jgi:vacuolar protein-sorting-associated protein 4
MDNTFIPKGMEIIKQAIDEDNADNYEKAYSLYEQGVKHLITGLKYVKQENSKKIITQKAEQYVTRMEQLKEIMDGGLKKPVVAGPSGGDGKSASAGSSDKKDDSETTKLKGALEGAIVKEKPNVKWEDVAGLEQAKKLLKETVILPAKFPHLFQGAVKPWRGILLYGPPGTGKSYLAKALATEAGSTFFSVSSSVLVSNFQGESERLVRNLFEMARENVPSIIFIDEVDSLCGSRSEGENESSRRIKTEFLVQMQGVGKGNDGILVLGATNTPWELDPAIRRRFEKRVYIPLPEPPARAAMFKIHIKDTPNTLQDADFMHLAKLTDGLQGGDISICVREALYSPVRLCQDATHFKKVADPAGKYDFVWTPCSPGDQNAVEMSIYDIEGDKLLPPALELKHFLKAVASTKAAVSAADIARHDEWTQEFGMEG